jgi:DNA helicase HerA-like ATPase
MNYTEVQEALGSEEFFGVLAGASTSEIVVYARNLDTSIGDLFLVPSDRGGERVYLFRMTQYANVLRREEDMDPMAKNLLAMDDPFYAEDFVSDQLLRLSGALLGYSEVGKDGRWVFRSPRKLPAHLSKVYKIGFGDESAIQRQEKCLSELLATQLGRGVLVGHLLAGERALNGVGVSIPGEYFAHHLGVFGRTGTGKSNNLMVLIESLYSNNQRLRAAPRSNWEAGDRLVSLFAIDPHDEFVKWKSGSRGGINRIVADMQAAERAILVGPFYYLSCRDESVIQADPQIGTLGRRVRLHRKDIAPEDIISIMEFSDIMSSAAESIGDEFGEDWISAVLNGDVQADENLIHKASLAGLNRRLGFLAGNRSNLVPSAQTYLSSLAEIVLALESGRILDVDTSLMTEVEQFLLTTVVARTIFALRKAIKSSRDVAGLLGTASLPGEIDRHIPTQDSLKRTLKERLGASDSPYVDTMGRLRNLNELPAVNIIVEEAPSILNPARLRFGSVFRDISRQGRKFGLGLTVVSQQVSEIDQGILSQINTEITLALGNEEERHAAVHTASNDIFPFKRELQVMGIGQAILSASYRSVPLPIQVPEFE